MGSEMCIRDSIHIRCPTSQYKQQLHTFIQDLWEIRWTTYPAARQTKQFFPSVHHGQVGDLLQLSRRRLSLVLQAMHGHNSLRYHQSLCNPGDSNTCRYCLQEVETFFHIYTSCPALSTTRFAATGQYQLTVPLRPSDWTVDHVLTFALNPFITAALVGREAPPPTDTPPPHVDTEEDNSNDSMTLEDTESD